MTSAEPHVTREPFEHVRLRYFLVWLGVTLVLLTAAYLASRNTFADLPPGLGTVAASVVLYASLALWAFAELRLARVPVRALFRRSTGGPGAATIGALAAAGLLFGLSWTWLVRYALIRLGAEDLAAALSPPQTLGSGWGWVAGAAVIFVVAGIAPVLEELTFRGLILRSWAFRYSLNKAIVFPALVFAFFHPDDLLGAFVLGVLYAVLYLSTRSLRVPTILHALNNVGAVVLGELWFEGIDPAVQTVAAVAIFVWSSIYLGRFIYRAWPRPTPVSSADAIAATP